MDDKTRFIQQLDAAHEKMLAVVAQVDTELEIYPGWTMKQVLAHLTGWDDATTSSLRAHIDGSQPATPAVEGIDFYNAQSVETREALNYEQTLVEWRLARDQLKAAINDLPPEKLNEPLLFAWGEMGSVARLVAIFVSHEEEHAEEILKHLGRSLHAYA